MTYCHENNKYRDLLSPCTQVQRKNIEGSKREKTNNIQMQTIKITADFLTET
jgi:hypothetical protein